MKVGILTFHRAHNYGAVLQCYALQKTISDLGHEAEVIDYRQPAIEYLYNQISLRRIKSIRTLVSYIIRFRKRYIITTRKRNIFESFTKKYLKLSKKCSACNFNADYNVIIIGSDQLWNKNCTGKIFDTIYFGDFKRSKSTKIVGYAISTNRSSIKEISNHYINLLSNFNSLSLRESFAIDELSKRTKKTLYHCIDPTLLTDCDFWGSVTTEKYKEEKKYIALYQVRKPYGKELLEEKAKTLAEIKGYNLIDLSNVTYNVEDFISIIRYAQCVITSSFHATVFSVIFNVPLYAFKLDDGSDDRYVNLLNDLDLNDCVVDINFQPQEIIKRNKEKIEEKLKSYKESSFLFLKNNVQDSL